MLTSTERTDIHEIQTLLNTGRFEVTESERLFTQERASFGATQRAEESLQAFNRATVSGAVNLPETTSERRASAVFMIQLEVDLFCLVSARSLG